jgi:hypothetical protein
MGIVPSAFRMIENKRKRKWAVENTNLETGETVRVMETPQDWTAELVAKTANEYFQRSERPYESRYFEL